MLVLFILVFLFLTNTTPAQRVGTISEIICAMGLGGEFTSQDDLNEMCRD